MKELEELRDGFCDELKEYAREYKNNPRALSTSDLEKIHHLTGTVAKLDRIIYGDEERGRSRGDWEARGTYGDDSSYAHRGEHYVRGHYSHDGEMSERRRDNHGRYSHDSGKSHMISELREMLDNATTEKERSAIRRCIEHMED